MSDVKPDGNSDNRDSRPPRNDGEGGGGGYGGGDRGGHGGGFDKKRQRPRYRKKVLDTRNLVIDYKNPDTLEKFISKTGKILPRRMTGATARIQRKIAREIKRARQINLLPFARR